MIDDDGGEIMMIVIIIIIIIGTIDMLVQFLSVLSFSLKYPLISNLKHWNGSSGFMFCFDITTFLLRCQHLC